MSQKKYQSTNGINITNILPKSHFLKCFAFHNQEANIFQILHEVINEFGKYETAAENSKGYHLWNRFHANIHIDFMIIDSIFSAIEI